MLRCLVSNFIMTPLPLICHPSTPSAAVAGIAAEVQRANDGWLRFRYVLRGELARIVLPEPAPPRHTDGLWRHTCFEAFISTENGRGYIECNFAPSTAWATYRFTGYRKQMTMLVPQCPPPVTLQKQADGLVLEAHLHHDEFAGKALRIGLTAVIEEAGTRTSYWALRHPRATAQPDFHRRAGFILRLGALSPSMTET